MEQSRCPSQQSDRRNGGAEARAAGYCLRRKERKIFRNPRHGSDTSSREISPKRMKISEKLWKSEYSVFCLWPRTMGESFKRTRITEKKLPIVRNPRSSPSSATEERELKEFYCTKTCLLGNFSRRSNFLLSLTMMTLRIRSAVLFSDRMFLEECRHIAHEIKGESITIIVQVFSIKNHGKRDRG